MTGEHVAMLAILAVPVGCWVAYNVFVRGKRQASKPTPWADGTKVAQKVRAMGRRGDD